MLSILLCSLDSFLASLGIGLAPIDGGANHDPVAGIARAYDATNLDPTPIDPHVG